MDREIFKEGQVVYHKASGERAVVVIAHRKCFDHDDSPFKVCADRCQREPTGFYSISLSFKEDSFEVDGDMLTADKPPIELKKQPGDEK